MEIVERREAMADKIERLESQVTEKVDEATSAVTHAVDTVTGTVQTSVDTVRDFFDVRSHVNHYPWAMLGGSVALGMLGGYLLPKPGHTNGFSWRTSGSSTPPYLREPARTYEAPGLTRRAEEPSSRSSWLGDLKTQLEPELVKLRTLAVGTLLGLVRDALVEASPDPLKQELHGIMDKLTTKFGGEPITGPILSSTENV